MSGNTVYRYELDIVDYQTVKLPEKHAILSVAPSRGWPNAAIDLWAIVNGDGPLVDVGIRIYGTGHPMAEVEQVFVGTCVAPNGLVWHVFYEGKAA